MGVVWQAHDERLHRTVAVKQLLLQPGLAEADTDEAKRRAMREGRIAARLQHPHAIAVYDVAEDDGQPWLVMEYLPSKSLSTVLSERGTLSPRDVANIGSQVASALSAAHNAGIVHRDIKPGNILLGDDGTVKITDFGISRATGDVTVTATGMLAGTPAYLAPEVAKGYDPGSPSDVFSLGSTLYAAVEGAPPFGLNENTIALLHQVASGKVVPPSHAGPLTALLMRLLRAEPEDRPTMAEAKEGLAAVAAGRAAPEFPMAAPTSHPPSWRGTPITVNQPSANRAMAPAGPQQQQQQQPPPPPNATRVDVRSVDNRGHAPGRQVSPPPPPPPRATNRPAAAPQYNSRPAASSPGNSKKSGLYTALAVVAAAVIGILAVNAFSDDEGNGGNNNAGSPGSSVVQPSGNASAPTSRSQAPAGGKTPKTDGYTASPTPEEQIALLEAYFELAPGDPTAAWQCLNPQMQGTSGGFDSYRGFWETIESVEITGYTPNDTLTYILDLEYTDKSGNTSTERKLISMQWSNSKLLLSKEQKLG
jgi:serine/threonine protein kinase